MNNKRTSILFAATLIVHIACAQEHLVPEPGILAEADEYHAKIRQVFASAYADDVILRVVSLVSFQPEEVAGIRKTGGGYEAFVITPSSTIWNTELVRLQESGQIATLDKDAKPIPPEKDKSFQDFKRRTPSDIRKITVQTKFAAISGPLAQRITRVWQTMLLDSRHPKKPRLGFDGATYHFSMWIGEHGIVSAAVWLPDERTRTFKFVGLANALSIYARGKSDETALEKFLKPLE